MEYIKNGQEIINGKIRDAHASGKSVVRVSGNYEISSSVIVPSGTTLLLEDCRLRLADGVYSRVFTNENAFHEGVDDYDIHIKGTGVTVIDGGNYNGLGEKTQLRNGLPAVWENLMILFSRVHRFSIEGIRMITMRWYAMAIVACETGTIRDIDFDGDCRRIDPETGEFITGLVRELYPQTYVKNGDGIDICSGSHGILIENVSGFTEDDTVALGTLFNPGPTPLIRECKVRNDFDVHDVIVRNIHSSCFCSPVRLLNQGGPKLYNILVDGIFDTSTNDSRLNHGDCGVMIGDFEPYGDRQPTGEETYNITVRNVYSRADTALRVYGGIGSFYYDNINGFDRCKQVIDVSGAEITGGLD